MNQNKINFAIVGVRNFAGVHIKNIQKLEKESEMELKGVVIRNKRKNRPEKEDLSSQGIKIFDSYKDLLNNGENLVDIISLPTSIHTHAEMANQAMKAGYNVLLEKPPAPTVEEIDRMIKTEKETGKFCSIGFQFIHSRSIRRLKNIILRGELGQIKEIATKGYWPRYRSYYERNNWAGRSIVEGNLVLDGPMHNAFAHYLNNMLFLASREKSDTASLKKVRAELYRGHTYIEADDTSCLEAETETGTKIYFYVNHTSQKSQDPYTEIIGEKGRAIWYKNEKTEINFNNGSTQEFDNEGIDPWLEVFRTTARAHRGGLERPYCTPSNCRNFVVAINGAYESSKTISPIPEEYVEEFETEGGKFKTEVENIEEIMDEAFRKRKLLSDLDLEWARPTDSVNVENYKRFQPFLANH